MYQKAKPWFYYPLIQAAVENIAESSIKHELKLNLNETKLIILCSTSMAAASQLHISLNNEIIENSDTIRNLGFIMNSNLRFRKHINSITQNLYCIALLIL